MLICIKVWEFLKETWVTFTRLAKIHSEEKSYCHYFVNPGITIKFVVKGPPYCKNLALGQCVFHYSDKYI